MTLRRFLSLTCALASCLTVVSASPPSLGKDIEQGSSWKQEVVASEPSQPHAVVAVEVSDADDASRRLPIRVVLTASDGSHPDGAGRGVYADGRFFADGSFRVTAPPGTTRLSLRSGPNFIPLDISLEARAGHEHRVQARLKQWFSPEKLGWYGGDNHVHVKHDAEHKTRTSRAYTVLQGRANGLSYITEAGSSLLANDEEAPSYDDFLMRHAEERRPGPFIGHRNTPGLTRRFPEAFYQEMIRRPLPTLALLDPIHRAGGAVIYTHPMSPPHLLHWMGASEVWSHAVLGRAADAFDIDSRATESLWFAMLNLGCRVAASGSTDAALERVQTPSPGDRRVYSKADQFTYEAIVSGIRAGRTFATNGGPLFAFLSSGAALPGDTLEPGSAALGEVQLEMHALSPKAKAELYWRGERVRVFPGKGTPGKSSFQVDLRDVAKGDGWFVMRAEDDKGNWAVTSPIYVRSPQPEERPFASALLLEISNHTRFIELRRDFFAHGIVTTSEPIVAVEFVRDGAVLRSFRPEDGNRLVDGKIPVTGMGGEYAPGWIWREEGGEPVHFQADWPVAESGEYAVRARTRSGRVISSEIVRFSKDRQVSHALSAAQLRAGSTRLVLHGYGEEMPLSEIRVPFEGDHWWYPKNTFWRMGVHFAGRQENFGTSSDAEAAAFFREADEDR